MKGGGTFLIFIAIVGLVLGGIILASPPSQNTDTNGTQQQSATAGDPTLINRDDAPRIGKEDAKVKIVVFSDYLCPYCESLHETLNKILSENSDVSLTSRNFIVHPQSEIHARASEAANRQGKFKEMNDELFNAGEADENKIVDIAKKIGLDVDKFKSDLNSDDIKTLVSRDNDDAQKLGLSGTPSVFLNNKPIEQVQDLESIVKSELGK